MRPLVLVVAAAAALLALSAPVAAHAEEGTDAALVQMSRRHEEDGLRAYKAGRYPESIESFKKAYLLLRAPRLLREIGLSCEKLKDTPGALYYYRHYLDQADSGASHREFVERRVATLERGRPAPHRKKHMREIGPPDDSNYESTDPPDENNQPDSNAWVDDAPRSKPRTKGAEPKSREASARETPPRESPAREPRAAEPPREVAVVPRRPTRADELPAPASGPMPGQWAHAQIDSAPAGEPIDVRVRTPSMKGVSVVLYYRGAGDPAFDAIEMVRQGPEVVARIPASVVSGTSLQYYIEAKRLSGALVKHSGSAGEPNIVIIESPPGREVAANPDGDSAAPRSDRGDAANPFVDGAKAEPASPGAASEEEHAPLASAAPGGDSRPRPSGDDEPSPLHASAPEPREGQRPAPDKRHGPFGTLGWVGLGLVGGGALLGGAAGGYELDQAWVISGAISVDGGHLPRYIFNDPNAIGANDKQLQTDGKLANALGITFMAVGGAMVATGVALIVVDLVQKPSEHPKRSHGRAANALRTPRIADFTLVPSFGSNGAGVSAGFAF